MDKVGENYKCRILNHDEDIRQKDQQLREYRDSVYHYVKTGMENKQLQKLIESEGEFRNSYKENISGKEVLEKIQKENLDELFLEDICPEGIECLMDGENTDLVEPLKHYSKIIANEVIKTLKIKMQKLIEESLENVAYMSHINMLYELREKENKLREEQREFEKMSQKYQYMSDITKEISKRRRLELEEIEVELKISKKDLENTINGCSEYFNIKEQRNKTQISLAPAGKKFEEYIINGEKTYSVSEYNEAVYQNSSNIFRAIEAQREINDKIYLIDNLKLKGITPSRERALNQQYKSLIEKLGNEREDLNPRAKRNKLFEEEKMSSGRLNIRAVWENECKENENGKKREEQSRGTNREKEFFEFISKSLNTK